LDAILRYTLHLADNALILGHRDSEWTGHGPILEQDIALSNISLDLIGQARNFYQYAALLKGSGATEDSLAYLRNENEFYNCLMVEQLNGDWGKTIMRQFLMSAFHHPYYRQLMSSADSQLSAIAEKSLKEVTYHLRWSSEWVIRLGQGTATSHEKMANAINDLWMFTSELHVSAPYEHELIKAGIAVDVEELKDTWKETVDNIFIRAGLTAPANVKMLKGGKEGKHTEHLKVLLNEMQYMQRTYPGVEW
jgi:ring-1,2-phenylacetyl-CoA epoxidase subunit PaaC